jgi:hypothetical protein
MHLLNYYYYYCSSSSSCVDITAYDKCIPRVLCIWHLIRVIRVTLLALRRNLNSYNPNNSKLLQHRGFLCVCYKSLTHLLCVVSILHVPVEAFLPTDRRARNSHSFDKGCSAGLLVLPRKYRPSIRAGVSRH